MRHGTASGYQRHACRCDACRMAQRDVGQLYRMRARYRSGPDEPRETNALQMLVTRELWMRDGECRRHPEVDFFPQRRTGENATDGVRAAKRLCAICPVREQCLDYAIRAGEKYGVWGGLSERERRPLRREWAQTALEGPESHANGTDVVRPLNGHENGPEGAVA